MQTNPLGISGQQGQQATVGQDAFSKLQTQDFLKLLVTELANQDPLNPMDNAQILQQISQLREIQATETMTATLESVLFGQNFTTANWLMGRNIVGLTEEGQHVTGVVERVTLLGKEVQAHVGDHVINLRNIAEVLPTDGEAPEEAGEQPPQQAEGAAQGVTNADALEAILNELAAEHAGEHSEEL